MKNKYIFGLLLIFAAACNQEKKEETETTNTNAVSIDTNQLKEKIRLDLEKEIAVKDSILKDSINTAAALKNAEQSKTNVIKKSQPIKKKEVVKTKPSTPVKKELTTEEKAINKFGGEPSKETSKEIEKKAIDKFGR